MKKKDAFFGYERREGVGVRNHVLILPTVVCSAKVAIRIAEVLRNCQVAFHAFGCGQAGEDLEITYRTLRNTACHPNVGAVLLVSLGCEKIPSDRLADEISRTGKRVELLTMQDVGGSIQTIKKGVVMGRQLVKEVSRFKRKTFGTNELTIAVKCGGSDWTSGISANPSVGYAMDMIIDGKGRVVFSETPEIIGAEHILLQRVRNQQIGKMLIQAVKNVEERFRQLNVPAKETNPSLGNIAGGITTLEEKSLGAIYKAGTRTLEGVLNYAEGVPKKAGLFFMDTPGQDAEAVSGMVAGGAQIVVFTTGLGTPLGNPIAPVIKITGNPDTYRKLKTNIDINAGTIIEGKETLEQVGERVYREIFEVASGDKTRSEILKHDEFSIFRSHPSF